MEIRKGSTRRQHLGQLGTILAATVAQSLQGAVGETTSPVIKKVVRSYSVNEIKQRIHMSYDTTLAHLLALGKERGKEFDWERAVSRFTVDSRNLPLGDWWGKLSGINIVVF